MPALQEFFYDFGRLFDPASTVGLRGDVEALRTAAEFWAPREGNDLATIARTAAADETLQDGGPKVTSAALDMLSDWPSALLAALQAVISENFARGAEGRGVTVPITFAWKPGYDYGIEVYDVADSATSVGGISVVVTTRYPTDRHPLTGFALS